MLALVLETSDNQSKRKNSHEIESRDPGSAIIIMK